MTEGENEAATTAVPPAPEVVHQKPSLDAEKAAEEKTKWLPKILHDNPEILELREQLLQFSGGTSFSQIIQAESTVALSHIDKPVLLELIFQHLNALGLYQTAEMVEKESGIDFQKTEEPWELTPLRILASLGAVKVSDVWNLPKEDKFVLIEEIEQEETFASVYQEDPALMFLEILFPNLNVSYIYDGKQNLSSVKTASMRRLITFLFLSKPTESEMHQLFLTLFNLTPSSHFFLHLRTTFYFESFNDATLDQKKLLRDISIPIRDNILEIIDKWVNYFGLFISHRTLQQVHDFLQVIIEDESLSHFHQKAECVLNSIPLLRKGITLGKKVDSFENPILPDLQTLLGVKLQINDLDPQEMARQITVIFFDFFQKIHIREFYWALVEHTLSAKTPNITNLLNFGEQFSLRLLEQICLSESKSDTIQTLYIVSCHLNAINNFEALRCVLQVLRHPCLANNDVIRTIKNDMDSYWRMSGSDFKTSRKYFDLILMNQQKRVPCIPNLRRDLSPEGDDSLMAKFIDGQINYEYQKLIAEKIVIYYEFQNSNYCFYSIRPIQNVFTKASNTSFEQMSRFAAAKVVTRQPSAKINE